MPASVVTGTEAGSIFLLILCNNRYQHFLLLDCRHFQFPAFDQILEDI